MDYIQLLVKTYDVTRTGHELGTMLSEISAEKGCVLVPTGFVNKLIEFHEQLEGLLQVKALIESESKDGSKEGN